MNQWKTKESLHSQQGQEVPLAALPLTFPFFLQNNFSHRDAILVHLFTDNTVEISLLFLERKC